MQSQSTTLQEEKDANDSDVRVPFHVPSPDIWGMPTHTLDVEKIGILGSAEQGAVSSPWYKSFRTRAGARGVFR